MDQKVDLQAQVVYPPDMMPDLPAHILAHRMMMNPENALSGETTEELVRELLKKIEVPLVTEVGS